MTFSDDLRRAAAPIWDAQLTHPFVRGIGDGTLAEDAFRFYIRQDYRFLIDYGRLLALGAARAPRLEWMRRFAGLAHAILEREMDLHRAFAARWGISAEELERERAVPTTAAYCDFLLRTAALGDFAELSAALLPCLWGYAEIGTALAAGEPAERYREWIDTYASDEFGEQARWARELVDAVAADGAHDRMHAAFLASSAHELAFWESAFSAGGETHAPRRPAP